SLQRLLVLEFFVDDVFERGDALDDLGDALQRHQGKADRQYQFDGPADQAAGIRRLFADAPAVDEPRPREIDQDDADRQQEQNSADDVDPQPRALRYHPIDE